jgi:hypothetical protein
MIWIEAVYEWEEAKFTILLIRTAHNSNCWNFHLWGWCLSTILAYNVEKNWTWLWFGWRQHIQVYRTFKVKTGWDRSTKVWDYLRYLRYEQPGSRSLVAVFAAQLHTCIPSKMHPIKLALWRGSEEGYTFHKYCLPLLFVSFSYFFLCCCSCLLFCFV